MEDRWRQLVRIDLPALARERAWPVSADHCFARILLDNAVGGCWYDHVSGRPAYRHIAEEALARAVALGELVIRGESDLYLLNHRSLRWRGRAGGDRAPRLTASE